MTATDTMTFEAGAPEAGFSKPRPRDFREPIRLDLGLTVAAVSLVAFGLIMIYSTTGVVAQERFGDAWYYFRRQCLAAVSGLGVMWLASRAPLGALRKAALYFFPIAIGLLVLTFIPGIGDRAGGARRWVNFVIRFQPGEMVKLAFVIFMAGYLARRESQLTEFKDGVIKPLLLMAAPAALFLLQPDFGPTMILLLCSVAMTTAAGTRLRYLMYGGALVGCCIVLLVLLSPYRLARVMSFLSPWEDASGKGYQLIQSLIAVGNGQMLGTGLGESQQKLFFLPAAHTDFIFAVIAEELGFAGCLVVLGLFLLILLRGLKVVARVADDTFLFSLAVGLTMLVSVPAMLNVGVVIGLLPTKGMVLPLVGYGGSSLFVCLTTLGLLQRIAREAASPFRSVE